MLDKNQDIVTDLTGWTFAGEIENKLNLTNSHFTVTGEKIELLMPHNEMGIMDGDYDLEIQGTIDEKIHTIYRESVHIINEIIDWGDEFQDETIASTLRNSFTIGDGLDTDKFVIINNGDENPPKLRYNATLSKWQLTHDGINWITITEDTGLIAANFVINETPVNVEALPSKRFRVANAFISEKLEVRFNGLVENYITIHSDTEFSFEIDIIDTDDILVSYIKA